MSLEAIVDALWSITKFSGVGLAIGGAIDFWIGKGGDRRIREWLETWWLRFDDVNARNFGRKEARFAVAVMDRLLGRRFSSLRRLLAVTVVAIVLCTIPVATTIVRALMRHMEVAWLPVGVDLVAFAVSLVLFSLAITITRMIAAGASRLKLNVLILSAALVAQLLLLSIWVPLSSEGVLFGLGFVGGITEFNLVVMVLADLAHAMLHINVLAVRLWALSAVNLRGSLLRL